MSIDGEFWDKSAELSIKLNTMILAHRGLRGFHRGGELEKLNKISGLIISSAMKVHTALGAGLFENEYQRCLRHEISSRGLDVQSEVVFPIEYGGIKVDSAYRVDLLVENQIIVELKSVSNLLALHRSQILTYLKISGKPLGLLINFNTPHLRDGIVRLINTSKNDNYQPSVKTSVPSVC